MTWIKLSNQGVTPFEKLLGHAPKILSRWRKLETAFLKSESFTPEFMEQIRRALAYGNECHYSMNKSGPPDKNPVSIRLEQALNFANQFAIDHRLLDENTLYLMKKIFSENELVEFVAYCSFISASQKIGFIFNLTDDFL